jgi:hypothetical protein
MRVNHAYLYWGAFLLALGGTIIAVDLFSPDPAAVGDLLRLWPVVIVAVGVAFVLRRTQLNVAGGMLAAAVPGLLLGGMIAVGPRVGLDCAPGSGEPVSFATETGTFTVPARVEVSTGCGILTITTRSGSAWELEAGNTEGNAPVVDASPNAMSVQTGRENRWFGLHGRDVWRLTLPTSRIGDLDVAVNAGEGRTDLAGADIGALALTTNAGRSTVDLGETRVGSFTATVNAGELSLALPTGDDAQGAISVNAGAAHVCVSQSVGLRVVSSGTLSDTDLTGLVRRGGVWESPDYASAAYHADLTVSVNLGSLDINPAGGCS